MSILEEAPGDRLPVQTYVLEYDDVILSDAIKKELHRGGQVFWLHNRVESIETTVAHVRDMVPEAKIAYAHGKMDREQISEIWSSLIMGETDVLISTTIIETGVDIRALKSPCGTLNSAERAIFWVRNSTDRLTASDITSI